MDIPVGVVVDQAHQQNATAVEVRFLPPDGGTKLTSHCLGFIPRLLKVIVV